MPRRRRDERCVHTKERPQQRNAANARERARMRVLSRAFCRLKTTLPWVPPDTKLSKLDTLRLATSYIAHLRAVLSDEAAAARAAAALVSDPPHPLTLTWPFSFTRGTTTTSATPSEGRDEADELQDEDDDDDWSQCSSSDVTSTNHVTSDHRTSFLASHFSDALMDIG